MLVEILINFKLNYQQNRILLILKEEMESRILYASFIDKSIEIVRLGDVL